MDPENTEGALAGAPGVTEGRGCVPAKFEQSDERCSVVTVREASRPTPHRVVGNTASTQALRAKLLASASRYAGAGMYVHPLLVGSKLPRWTSWEERATLDPEVIEQTWGRAPFNIGIACGPSRLVVVDLDVPGPGVTAPEEFPGVTDGWSMLCALAARAGGEIAPTMAVRTPSGGRHLLYRAPDAEVRNTARTIGWLIDTRAAGGYVVGIGSAVDGSSYRLEGSITAPAPLPEWLLTLLLASPEQPKCERAPRRGEVVARLHELTRQGTREQRWAAGILRSECDELAALRGTEGGRNGRLNLAAYRAGQLVASGLLDQAVAEEQLTEAALEAGLNDKSPFEVEKTLRSGMSAGLSRPRRMDDKAVRQLGGAA
ncbi:bifunctional DNA primase/polymerase [Streptomyces sp. NPDC059534]|uniref:bifunctional DNA primase/polymerase n=1 Tax=Streptomyces sp. NPDC059534 TaxID=3346859 RepID=UPI00368B6597